ncbi:MAG: hypothetical protein IJZ74_00180 [Clostridia bacterium]|nr:hypothetical protein [Clostridia bacterium]
MRGNWRKRLCYVIALTVLLLPITQRWPEGTAHPAYADGITSSTDLPEDKVTEAPTATPVPTEAPTEAPTVTPVPTEAPTEALTATPVPTEAPTEAPTVTPVLTEAPTEAPTVTPEPEPTGERRSGYALLQGGVMLWANRQRTEELGRTSGAVFVWVPDTAVSAKTYKVMFDTAETKQSGSCHTAYVRAKDVDWLFESESRKVITRLEKQDVRRAGGALIPVISVVYSITPAPAATPTVTPVLTAEVTAAPTETPAPTAEVTAAPTETPAPTAEVTAAPTEMPAPTAEVTAAPTETPAPTKKVTASPTKKPVKPAATAAPSPAPSAAGREDSDRLTTETDLTTATPVSTPVRIPVQEPVTGTDLVTPAPQMTVVPATPVPPAETPAVQLTAAPVPMLTAVPPLVTAAPQQNTATDTDLPGDSQDVTTGTDLAPEQPKLSAAEMKALLDVTHPDRQLTLRITCTNIYYTVGSRMSLWADVTGYDGLEYQVIWEVDRGDGWVNAGMDGLPGFTFIITEENCRWNWRAGVSVTSTETE